MRRAENPSSSHRGAFPRIPAALTFVALLTTAATHAAPLKLAEIKTLGDYVACSELCPTLTVVPSYDQHLERQDCLARCGEAPRTWEKDGVHPVTRSDQELALLEYQQAQDPTQAILCYADAEETIVIPGALCAGAVCEQQAECTAEQCAASATEPLSCAVDPVLGEICWWPDTKRPAACPDLVCTAAPAHSQEDCTDTDSDGMPSWLEGAVPGFDPTVKNDVCNATAPCAIGEGCAYVPELGTGLCKPRACVGACTAFHLELVAQDDHELVVHLHYDHTPVPARVLDLYLTYDHAALTLHDSRALAPLSVHGKQVATSHLSNGALRVTVFDAEGTHPIPTGPIVELVFRRTSAGPTIIAFATDDALQTAAVAPLHGAEASLADDALWGPAIAVGDAGGSPAQLSVWYGFDSLSAPLTVSSAPSAAALCEKVADCALETDPVRRAAFIGRLESLQAGALFGGDPISGVSGAAVWLDGTADHMRLPVDWRDPLAPIAQSFSVATWFYTEGNSVAELKTTPQILFGHKGYDERTRFALLLRPEAGGSMKLALLEGDVLQKAPAPKEVDIASGLALREWHHAGLVVDAALGKVEVYLDGVRMLTHTIKQPPALAACPQFFAATDVVLHEEGDLAGGKPPEDLFLGIREAGLYGIARVEPSAVEPIPLVDDSEFSYRDPDYSPLLDRLVYAANVSGSFEIWVADGRGNQRRQLTRGFGDAVLGFSARHPRWAPDGSALVFESGAFDVLADDNTPRVKHLYVLPWDATTNEAALDDLPSGSGDDGALLDYGALLASQAIGEVRVTAGDLGRHHTNAHWLLGKTAASRGVLVLNAADPAGASTVVRAVLRDPTPLSTLEPVPGLDGDVRLLAAHHAEKAAAPQPIVTEHAFVVRSSTSFQFTSRYAVTESSGTVEVRLTAQDFGANCWDTNLNKIPDASEDADGNGNWNNDDCYPSAIDDLYVEFDGLALSPRLEDGAGNPLTPGDVVTSLQKDLQLDVSYLDGRAFVRVAVVSPLNAKPLRPGLIAALTFVQPGLDAPAVTVAPFLRTMLDELLVKDLSTSSAPAPFASANLFEQVEDAAFSPSGDRLLLAAIASARPVLLRTTGLTGAGGAAKLLVKPARVRGVDWERQDRFMACNWIGAVQHPQSKALLSGFRGGLDEFKVWRGLRDPDAFRSEAERGREFIDGSDVTSLLPSCSTSHQDCPDYHLCVENVCRLVECNPEDPYACLQHGGRCTLRPLAVEQEFKGPGGKELFQWVCAADCDVDTQCFTEPCLNGPCRFCDTSSLTCIECRDAVKQLGELSIEGIEGCPDERSFRCESGACLSDCYTVEDGESVYLCDPATEYCDRGRCVLHEWSWWDLAPATLTGGGEMRQDVAPEPGLLGWKGYTQAVDQRIPVTIAAYGVSDVSTPPEVIVEAKGGPFYPTWQRVGTLSVHATTSVAAQQNPVTLVVPHPFTELRMQLVTSPFENATGGATGLGDKDKDFCRDDITAAGGTDTTVCDRRAQGSRYSVGYALDIAPGDAIRACVEAGGAGCPFAQAGEFDYLRAGAPAAVIVDVQVRGASVMNAVTSNTVCAYGGYGAGALLPSDADGEKKVLYGDVATEQSPERDAFCAAGGDCGPAGASGLVSFPVAAKGFALLNCNVVDPGHQGEAAEVRIANIPIVTEWPARAGAIVQDTGDTCLVEVTDTLNAPCYAWTGGDAALDPAARLEGTSGPGITYGLLDVTWVRSFGFGEGFQSAPVTKVPFEIEVTGSSPSASIACPGASGSNLLLGAPGTFACPTIVSGSPYTVRITQSSGDVLCTFQPGGLFEARGWVGVTGTKLQVKCDKRTLVTANITGLPDGKALILRGELRDDGKNVSGLADFTRNSNGPLDVAALPAGGAYDLSLFWATQGVVCTIPNGKGTVGAVAPAPIAVNCKAAASVALAVTIDGVEGTLSGLTIREAKTGLTVTPTAPGKATFADTFTEGTTYELEVDTADSSGLACNLTAGGAGTFGATETDGGTVTCNRIEDFAIGGTVAGLAGTGLVLQLNGANDLSIADPKGSAEPVSFTFAKEVLNGKPFAVTVKATPTVPSTSCKVINGTGVVEGKSPEFITVVCSPAGSTESAYVKGTVKGLKGSGFRLSYAAANFTLDVAPPISGDAAFAFPTPLVVGQEYGVVVSRQPSAPTQYCTVEQPETLMTAAPAAVVVTCVDASTVSLTLTLPNADGAPVTARLFGTVDGKEQLVAVAPKGVKVKKGSATFSFAEPVPNDNDQYTTAHLPGGTYRVVYTVNDDGNSDTATGQPLYDAGDAGRFFVITVTAGTPYTETMAVSPPGKKAAVTLSGAGVKAHVDCYWTYAYAPLDLPPKPTSPVVARARYGCTLKSGETTCSVPGGLTETAGVVWPLTEAWLFGPEDWSHQVVCWADNDGDGALSTGDAIKSSTTWSPSSPSMSLGVQ